MTLKVSAPNGVKVYNVAGGKSLPDWLSQRKKESLRKDETFRRRVELVQELEFPTSSSRVKVSHDGNFLVVTGIHPPQARRLRCGEGRGGKRGRVSRRCLVCVTSQLTRELLVVR